MEFDFEQISEMLGSMSEEEMQNLQEAAQSLFSQFGGEGADESEPQPPQPEGGSSGAAGVFGAGMFTPELLASLTQIMQRMNARDARTDLILALRPHLSRRRQHRAEQAVQMIKMLDLLPALQETMRSSQ